MRRQFAVQGLANGPMPIRLSCQRISGEYLVLKGKLDITAKSTPIAKTRFICRIACRCTRPTPQVTISVWPSG
jgi:hypothetical protein